MHTCCAPCFVAPYDSLKSHFEVTALWFNGNIHPVLEYQKRRDTLREFVDNECIKYIEKDDYGLIDFIQKSAFREESRCLHCYHDRLSYAAILAKKGGYDYFSTSLLYSKFQKHDLMREIGLSLAEKHDIEFYYQDFRELWKVGIESSKEKNMYRQQYCGCIYSKMKRYGA